MDRCLARRSSSRHGWLPPPQLFFLSCLCYRRWRGPDQIHILPFETRWSAACSLFLSHCFHESKCCFVGDSRHAKEKKKKDNLQHLISTLFSNLCPSYSHNKTVLTINSLKTGIPGRLDANYDFQYFINTRSVSLNIPLLWLLSFFNGRLLIQSLWMVADEGGPCQLMTGSGVRWFPEEAGRFRVWLPQSFASFHTAHPGYTR